MLGGSGRGRRLELGLGAATCRLTFRPYSIRAGAPDSVNQPSPSGGQFVLKLCRHFRYVVFQKTKQDELFFQDKLIISTQIFDDLLHVFTVSVRHLVSPRPRFILTRTKPSSRRTASCSSTNPASIVSVGEFNNADSSRWTVFLVALTLVGLGSSGDLIKNLSTQSGSPYGILPRHLSAFMGRRVPNVQYLRHISELAYDSRGSQHHP